MKYKTIKDAKCHLVNRIAEVEAKLETTKRYSDEDIKKAQDAFLPPLNLETIRSANAEALEHPQLSSELEMLKGSLDADLMVVPTRYLMAPAGSTLTSPSGFHQTERVFLNIPGALFTDRLPKQSNMIYWDISKIK